MARPLACVVGLVLAACTSSRPPSDAASDTPRDATPDAISDIVAPPPLPDLTPDPNIDTTCPTAPPAAGNARAKPIVCHGELASGPLAMGRVGDVVIENARVRYVLRTGTESATVIGGPAGGIVDATLQSVPRVDALREALPLLNDYGLAVGDLAIVRAGGSDAAVRAPFVTREIGLIAATLPGVFQRPLVHGVLEYALRGDDDTLRLRICALVDTPTGVVRAPLGVYAGIGGGAEVLAPGTGVLTSDLPNASAPAIFAETPDLAYGLRIEGSDTSVVHVATTNLFNGQNAATFSGNALQCATIDFAAGATEADVNATLLGSQATQSMDVTVPPGGRAAISDAMGHDLLRSRETHGTVHAVLGAGVPTVRVARANGAFGDPASPPPTGTLDVTPTVTGETGAPVRITVEGIDDPAFALRFVATAETQQVLPAGQYRVTASRGIEYTLATAAVTIPPDGTAPFAPTLAHVVDTTDYVSTDFHLHTELSTDSAHRVVDTVRQMAGEGLELVSGTDHDFVADHASLIPTTDVAGWIVAVAGDEVSTTHLGHFAGYPLDRDVARAGANAVPWFSLTPTDIFRELRSRGTDVLVQVNHPRLHGSGYFDRIGLDPAMGTASTDPTSLGFPAGTNLLDLNYDVLEVWNGYTRGGNEQALSDYLALRASGHRSVMVGNSDSHVPDLPPGAPRSFVRVGNDARGQFGWSDVRTGLLGGDVSVGAGIFVEMHAADGTRPGGVAHASAGAITIHVRVQAPPWADCSRLRIYRGVDAVVDQPITTPSDQVVRFDGDLTVAIPASTFLVARADGTRDATPIFPWPPFGVTNPMDVSTGP